MLSYVPSIDLSFVLHSALSQFPSIVQSPVPGSELTPASNASPIVDPSATAGSASPGTHSSDSGYVSDAFFSVNFFKLVKSTQWSTQKNWCS